MDFFESEGENTDSDEVNEELESELYSVLHYNILSAETPSNLLEKYDIKRNECNEILISFKSATKKQKEGEDRSPIKKHESDEETIHLSVNSTNDTAFQDVITISDESSSDNSDVLLVNKPSVDFISLSSSSSDSELNEISSDSDMENGMVLNIGHTPKPSIIPPVIDDSEEETVAVKWNQVISPGCWTKHMKKYYNRPCKELKNFDFDKFREEIKGTGNWHISPADRFPSHRKNRRCFICRQTGHLSENCPRKFARCSMCSDPGHEFYDCPSMKCLNCGLNAPGFVEMCPKCEGVRYKTCRECGQIGHLKQLCPNTWRKYHSTTAGELVIKQESLNPNLMCCNCARIGHLYEHCPKTYFSIFPPTSCIINNKKDGSVPVHGDKRPGSSLPDDYEVYFDRTPKMTKLKHYSTSTPRDQNQASSSFKHTPKRGNRPDSSLPQDSEVYFDRTPNITKHHSTSTPSDQQASSSFKPLPRRSEKQRYFQNHSFGSNLETNTNNSNRVLNNTNSPFCSPDRKKRKKKLKKLFHNDTL